MTQYSYKIFNIVLFIFVVCNCSLNEDEEIVNFQINTERAKLSLQQIMYKTNLDTSILKSTKINERFKIVHISDPHLSKWTSDNHYTKPKNLIEAVEFSNLTDLKINAIVATGDFISNNNKTTVSDASAYITAFISFLLKNNNIPSFVCTGNHDTNTQTNAFDHYLDKQNLNNLLFTKTNYQLHQPSGENYYYADLKNPAGGIIRIIALDNTDQDIFQHKTLFKCCITQKQVNWLINIALTENMTQNHHVIILTHHPLQPFSKDLSTYMCSGTHLYSEKMIPDIINAFIKKEVFNRKYDSTDLSYQSIQVEADFTNTPGEFISYMGGHAHTPTHFEVKCNDQSPAKQIMLLANTLSPDFQNNNYTYIKRNKSDISSNSFSIYAIDTQEKKIYVTYFGAKSSSHPTIESISYR